MQKGSLEVICGSMFSGKTEELMRRLKRAEYARQTVLCIKHEIDLRSSYTCICSHNGEKREAFPLGNCEESLKKMLSLITKDIDVVGIDEIQFFPQEIVVHIQKMIHRGKRVIVSGLDLDFRGEPFGNIPTLLALADEIIKLRAICMSCGKEAFYSQRLIDGKPARYDDPQIKIGASECYEARCRNCFQIAPHIDNSGALKPVIVT